MDKQNIANQSSAITSFAIFALFLLKTKNSASISKIPNQKAAMIEGNNFHDRTIKSWAYYLIPPDNLKEDNLKGNLGKNSILL